MPGRRHIALLSVVLFVVLLLTSTGSAARGGRDRQAPTQPGPLVVTSSDASSIAVTWQASADNVGVTGYDIFLGRDLYATNRTDTLSQVAVVQAVISGLRCGEGYTVGVEAFDDSDNRSPRTSAVLTTAACPDTTAPTAPGSFTQVATTGTSVLLGWAPSTDDRGVVGYAVYRGVQLMTTTAEPNALIAQLTCNTTTPVSVYALDAAGNRSPEGRANVTTARCTTTDTTAPSAPDNQRLVGAGQTSITMGWTAATDNVGVTGYDVYRDGTKVGSTGSGATSYTYSGLVCGTTYTVGLVAFDAAGNRSNLAEATGPMSTATCSTTPPPPGDTTAPTPPSGVGVYVSTASSIGLSWKPATDNVGVTGYDVYRNGSKVGSTASDATSYTYAGLSCGTTYTVGLVAFDATGNRSSQAAVQAATAACASTPPPSTTNDTTAPSAPDNQRLVGAGQTSITMGWTAATDNVGVTGYDVYRDGTKVGSTGSGATSYTYSGLVCGTTYTVGLVAFDAAGNRSNLAEATGPMSTATCSTTPPPPGDTTAPTPPSGVGVYVSTASSIGLSWKPATDNVGVTGYGVYRNGSRVSTVSSLTSTVDTLSCGTAYTLGVDAVDAAGNRSSRTDTTATTNACVDTQAPAAPTNIVVTARTATSIAVSWSASTDNVGVTGYDLYVDGTKVSTGSQTNAIAGSLTCGRNYTLGVVAYDASGNRSTQSTVMVATTACGDTTPPSAPSNQRLISSTQTSITMGWTAATDNVGVTGYDVYRGGAKLATTPATATSYTFTGLSCSTTYSVGVVAFDAAGNRSSLASATASMATPTCSAPAGGASVYLSPSGNDSAPCTSASPCKTVERGYATVSSGGVVQMADGFYPCATVSGSKQVTFQAASGAKPWIACTNPLGNGVGGQSLLLDSVSNLTLTGVYIAGIEFNGGSNITFNDVHVTCLNDSRFALYSGYCNAKLEGNPTSLSMHGGEVGPTIDNDVGGYPGNSRLWGNDLSIDGVTFHDNVNLPGGHSECLMVRGGDGIKIRNSEFLRCNVFSIFFTCWPGNGDCSSAPAPKNVLVENNYFGPGPQYYSLMMAGHMPKADTYRLRYNTLAKPVDWETTPVNSEMTGNIVPYEGCASGVTYAYNVVQDAESNKCASTDKSVQGADYTISAVGVDGSGHLSPTSPAVDAGNGSSYPSQDMDGDSRPAGGRPDAGADEVR